MTDFDRTLTFPNMQDEPDFGLVKPKVNNKC